MMCISLKAGGEESEQGDTYTNSGGRDKSHDDDEKSLLQDPRERQE
jgi:hypothetical protein